MIAGPSLTIDRIQVATPESPVAVFTRIGQQTPSSGRLYSYFANTVITQDLVKSKKNNCVGVFHNQLDLAEVENILNSSVLNAEVDERRNGVVAT